MTASSTLPLALPRAVPTALPATDSQTARKLRSHLRLRAKDVPDFSTQERSSARLAVRQSPGCPGAISLDVALLTFAIWAFAGLAFARPAHRGGVR